MSFSANDDRKYIHDVVCKVQVVKFEPKSGLCVCISVVLVRTFSFSYSYSHSQFHQ